VEQNARTLKGGCWPNAAVEKNIVAKDSPSATKYLFTGEPPKRWNW
jgi:hypothetical protein